MGAAILGRECSGNSRESRRERLTRIVLVTEKDLERFWSKVNKTSNCWLWTSTIVRDGYGTLVINGKLVKAHRFSFALASGDPGKLRVLHKCDSPSCVNPDHLFLGAVQTPEERFWSYVTKTPKCWEWTGVLNRKGYGQFTIGSRVILAHRYSYLNAYGNLGDLCVCHHCDNPKCVNPEHLFLDTRVKNNEDCANKGRVVKGSQVGSAKLTEQDVVAIREKYARGGVLQRVLAAEYGVCQQVISKILTRQGWKHV